MQFIQNGVTREFIQIGTVMTDKAYQNQGLAKKLMEHVMAQYEGRCDGIYLFSDLGALGFYRGKALESIEKEKLFFPLLSHA